MQTFQVLMVGPTRVGKTSTLASMSESLRTEVNKLQYHTTIPQDLLATVTQFRDSVNQNEIVVKSLPLKRGTGDKTSYTIDLISQSQAKDISVEFIDVPGGWYIPPTQERPNTNYEEVKNLLKSSIASLWCIDCVSMIEGKNDPEHDYHRTRNEPQLITELYKNIDGLSAKKHRIIFVLMRAETYIHDNSRGSEWLINQFDEFYGPYISEIKRRFPNGEIEIFVTFVETLGCFKFRSWQKDSVTGELEATYRKFASKYAPCNCEAPALMVIDCALQEAMSYYKAKKEANLLYYQKKRKGFVGRIVQWCICSVFGGDPNESSRAEDIYQNLVAGKPIDPSEYRKEFMTNPELNAHITFKRLEEAAKKMGGLVDKKKTDNLVHLR